MDRFLLPMRMVEDAKMMPQLSGRIAETTLRIDNPKDGSSGPESSEDSDDWLLDGHCVVQVLAISANFPICTINDYDQFHGRCIYAHSESEVQEVYLAYIISTIALCLSHTDMYYNKLLKPFTFMLERAGWNDRFGAHWTQ